MAKVRATVHCRYLGKPVILDEDGWVHTLKGHPEFADPAMEAAVGQAIADPICITDNAVPGKKVAYYRAAPWPTRRRPSSGWP